MSAENGGAAGVRFEVPRPMAREIAIRMLPDILGLDAVAHEQFEKPICCNMSRLLRQVFAFLASPSLSDTERRRFTELLSGAIERAEQFVARERAACSDAPKGGSDTGAATP